MDQQEMGKMGIKRRKRLKRGEIRMRSPEEGCQEKKRIKKRGRTQWWRSTGEG